MCGEHQSRLLTFPGRTGSSPRVRGTLHGQRLPGELHGIIPACAGNTFHHLPARRRCRDHPRVCGEHGRRCADCYADLGSSPRVRGTRRDERPRRLQDGIIPACAGNTLENTSSKSRKRKAKLHFNQFAEEMQRCLTVRFCAMGSFVVKVQQVKHGFQTIVWRLW